MNIRRRHDLNPAGRRLAAAALTAAALVASRQAGATGVAGDRLFPSTLIIEDTQNDDELALPTVTYLQPPKAGEGFAGNPAVTTEYSRLLTPDLALGFGAGWRRLGTDQSLRNGWDNVDVLLKYRTIVDAPHEFLLSTAIDYEIGGSGAARIGADRFDTVQPIVSFGKGFGDLPRSVDWLRPLAVAGAFGSAFPTGSGAKLLHYGASLQYSLLYRDRYIAPGPAWARSLIPLVEFAVETPAGRSYGSRTAAIAAPGIAWIGDTCQITAEALLPLNAHGGRGVGAIAQLHIFLDELLPSVFGRPVFGGGKDGDNADHD